jgi:predicted DNA-binding transcriptional regulator AlpA
MSFDLLTRAEAAQKARMSPRTLDLQVKAGTGPAVTRIGGRVLFCSDEFESWVRRQTVQPAADARAV